ncbi:uncharacterized protein LOC109727596 [Ananas comosus]|uniref:Uncharacterized protein LOC109727596 n=1 Tax=Ananas comosus TaxID=4615 RepID=A0A199VU29_ANACO|nr:uncharacterized protein LOC109727596 [Ananas comosus]OAY80727.1 hypothetical protein ACMD2_09646 [Ananas comosus]
MTQSGNCTTLLQYRAGGTALDALMVVVSVIMGLLAVLLLVRGFLGRLSGAAASATPTVRYFLWVVFALFLPLTSYMFSEVKNSGEVLRPQLILLWMILAEILRKKLEGVSTINDSPLQGVNKQSTWDAVDQIVRIAWLGYLIYTYAIKWVLVALWAFSIVKVAQRVAAVEFAKCSFALGKSPHLIAGYMRQLSEEAAEQQQHETAAATGGEVVNNATTAMKACKYVIMGEDNVTRKVGPHGYSLPLSVAEEREKMVTVGDVWQLAASGDTLFASRRLKLKDLCLSFALYKLLRRRFEEYSSAEAGRHESLHFLLRGLLGDDNDDSPRDKGERVFRVIEDELSFLSDYYYSTIPLMLSNLWFFLLNCALVFVIPLFCSIVIFVSIVIGRDGLIWCVFDQLINKEVTVSILYYPTITLFLIATLFSLELVEVVVYVLSDWVMVSLLCIYAKKPSWRQFEIVGWALTMLRRVKTYLNRVEFKFNQHSILEPRGRTLRIFSQLVLRQRFLLVQSTLLKIVLHRRYLGVRSTPVPKEVKAVIAKYLVGNRGRGPVLPIGESVLWRNGAAREELLQACKSDGAAETIIVWHIATCLYEMKHPSSPPSQQQPQQSDDHDMQENRRIAETLSKYCAYLVALAPELLPDDAEATATVYKAAVKEIQDAILRRRDHKADNFERVTSMKKANGTAAERGAMLGHQLVGDERLVEDELLDEQLVGDERLEEWQVWKLLAELWTEIVVYIAPSDDVKSHAQALAHGGEFITHIWALLTHGGILRWPAAADENAPPPPPPPAAADDQSPV